MADTGPQVAIRPGRDDDAEAFIALIGGCWTEYPGVILDVDGELPELRALATYVAAKHGALWAAEADGGVVGMIAVFPGSGPDVWEIGKLYVARPWRGSGIAHRLLDAAEGHARAAGASRIALWSDTRFAAAHAFYEKRSYLRSGPIRALDDVSNTLEFHFAKPLTGIVVEPLGAAQAESAIRRFAEVLCACVATGASVSFLDPLPIEQARAFWKRRAADVARGTRVLIGAWLDGALVGTVTLDFDLPQNQPHRAELQKMLVHPDARRRGVGRALIAAGEAETLKAGRRLVTFDSDAAGLGPPLYRAAGYQEAGIIPGYALFADGRPCDTIFFYKALA